MEENINNIKAIKIDIEGLEYRVLRHFLSNAPSAIWPKHVIIELNPVKSAALNPVDLLLSNGYRMVNHVNQNCMLSL